MKQSKFNGEELVNHFAMKCISFTFIGITVVSILNWLKIFGTDRWITQIGYFIVFFLFLVSIVVVRLVGFSPKWMKYFLITIVELMTLSITATLTYHAVIITVFPIIYASVFQNKKLSYYTQLCSCVGLIAAVYIGYFYGVCDLNIIFLPTKNIRNTILDDGKILGSDFILDGTWWKLLLYIAFPRIIIVSAFVPVCRSITNMLSNLQEKANVMEDIAIHDGMTGLFNKRYYLESIDSIFKKEELLGIIYIDVNNLKYVNDKYGHDAGDQLIRHVSTTIQSVQTLKINGYRVGGDEFLIAVNSASAQKLYEIAHYIRDTLEAISSESEFPVSAAIGYSVGKGIEYDEILKNADAMMYIDKNKNHQSFVKVE